jgi:hypothetical protein
MLYFRPKYALNHMGFESGRVFFDGRCFTHRGERHSFAIDAEIACLERAKALLSASGTVVARRKPGRAAKVAIAVAPKVQKARKRRRISAEGRERVRQAQIKRWAALNTSKANMNATVRNCQRGRRRPQRQLDVTRFRFPTRLRPEQKNANGYCKLNLPAISLVDFRDTSASSA